MKKIVLTPSNPDYPIIIYSYEVGDCVWVVSDEGKIVQCKVANQEWWDSNPYHPVYYDLTTLNGEVIGCSGSGNWNFSELFWAKD